MRALLSAYDKTGLEAFAAGLVELGWDLVASGNTAELLVAAGIPQQSVESVTSSPEMLGGRVKTLHPRIHGGILADLSEPSHVAELESNGIEPISLVCCNLYPFSSRPSLEMIDIGGPAMARSAAKNHAHVTVIVDPSEYGPVLDELRREGDTSAATRRRLARAAFAHTAAYDATIVSWFDDADAVALPPSLHLALKRVEELRYGENPHQAGARYASWQGLGEPGFWDGVVQHGGQELSYLNLFDAEAAWRLAHEAAGMSGTEAAVVVKHANPCGVGVAPDPVEAYTLAFDGDPVSAFGGVVAVTGRVGTELAGEILERALCHVLVAPAYEAPAVELLTARRRNMRVLEAPPPSPLGLALRQVDGGYLVQEPDSVSIRREEWSCVTKAAPTEEQWAAAELAVLVCARTVSNAITIARPHDLVGVGCGQPSRVDAAEIAARKAGERARGAAAASDAFFPFRDGLDALADAAVAVVVQPGGSLRDDEIIEAADERNIAMVMTGERHFRH